MSGNAVTKNLRDLLKNKPQELIFPSEYLYLGSPEAVNTAFYRLAKEGLLIRLGKGIYLHPVMDPAMGNLYPSLEKIALGIAAKERVIIKPTGVYALNRLGLSTQVPTKVVFLTNGNPRKIKIGKSTITFKQTTPKKLNAQSEVTFLAIQALLELGEQNVTKEIIDKLAVIMKAESTEHIIQDAQTAPIWIAKILHTIAKK